MDETVRLELTYINDALLGLSKMVFIAEYSEEIDLGEVACLIVACQEKLRALLKKHEI